MIGIYVGAATAASFVWWFLAFSGGPQMTWHDLRHSQTCVQDMDVADAGRALFADGRYACSVFEDRRPSTVAMSVLVVVEMFNALNAISENGSLLVVPPWRNWWLVAAIAVSMALHMAILCAPALHAMHAVVYADRSRHAAPALPVGRSCAGIPMGPSRTHRCRHPTTDRTCTASSALRMLCSARACQAVPPDADEVCLKAASLARVTVSHCCKLTTPCGEWSPENDLGKMVTSQ